MKPTNQLTKTHVYRRMTRMATQDLLYLVSSASIQSRYGCHGFINLGAASGVTAKYVYPTAQVCVCTSQEASDGLVHRSRPHMVFQKPPKEAGIQSCSLAEMLNCEAIEHRKPFPTLTLFCKLHNGFCPFLQGGQ